MPKAIAYLASPIVVLLSVFPVNANSNLVEELDIDPAIVEDSPVLQRWGEQIPDILDDIRNDPSFKTRVQLGYFQQGSSDNPSVEIGVADLLLGNTGITANLSYRDSLSRDRAHWKSDLAYSLFPLGNYVNVAPVVGYHAITTPNFSEQGLNLGLQVRFVLSRTGAAEIRLTQSFIDPGQASELGVTNLTVGYAITEQIRLSVEFETQRSSFANENYFGLLTEWQFR